MASDFIVLGFDTSAAHCAAAVLSGDRVLASRAEEMTRGQAERLIPLVEEALTEAGLAWGDIGRIGVGIGPGNFTGIRISVAAARGLSLSLGIPVLGISTLDAIGGACPAVPAPREQAYMRGPDGSIVLCPRAEVPDHADWPPASGTLAVSIARLARERTPGTPPAPLYVRPADAAPARDAPPVILDDA